MDSVMSYHTHTHTVIQLSRTASSRKKMAEAIDQTLGGSITSPNVLDEDDLFDIMEDVGTMASKWRNIGTALGLRQDVLESIRHTEHSDQMQMTKMLTEWLRRNYDTRRFGMPTWKKLVEAIKARTGGGNTALAQRIAEKHLVMIAESQPRVTPLSAQPKEEPSKGNHICCCFKTDKNESLHLSEDTRLATTSERKAATTPQIEMSTPKTSIDPIESVRLTSIHLPPPGFQHQAPPHQFSFKLPNPLPPPPLHQLPEKPKKPITGSIPIQPAVASWRLRDIKDHPSYRGSMTGAEAEEKLKQHGGNCYLIRYSDAREVYVLSVMRRINKEEPISAHFKLNIIKRNPEGNTYEIEGTEKKFDDISKLLLYYHSYPIDHKIKGIGDPCPENLVVLTRSTVVF